MAIQGVGVVGVSMFTPLSAVFVVMLTILWLLVSGRTLYGAYHGNSFVSPLAEGTAFERAPPALPARNAPVSS